jgi:DNA polymerase-3 subunit delta'
MNYYPWHDELWQKIMRMRSRMPHALLLQGRAGIGKLDFAAALAQALLCDHPQVDQTACGTCSSCNWFLQDNHPDFRRLEPGESSATPGDDETENKPATKKTQIAVDQVRDLADFFGLSSHRAGLRVVLLHPAEALNPSAANALLKMLEEPPPSVLFLLVTHNPQRLLATIRSRCSKLDMPVPPRLLAEQWLIQQGVQQAAERISYTGGAPLLALALEEGAEKRWAELHVALSHAGGMDVFAAATSSLKEGLTQVVDALQKWTYDLLSVRMTGAVRYHTKLATPLQDLAKRVDLPKLLEYQRSLNEARRSSRHPLNPELQVESLMIQYTQLFATPQKP